MMSNSPNLNSIYNCTIVDQFKKTILRVENDFINGTEQISHSSIGGGGGGGSNNNNGGSSPININSSHIHNHLHPHSHSSHGHHPHRLSPPITLSPRQQHQIHQTNLHPQLSLSPNNMLLSNDQIINSSSPSLSSSSNNNTNNNIQPIKLYIGNNRKTIVYILVTVAIATITNCHDCTIVLGPCCDYIEISDCSSTTIISITKGIRIKSSTNINVNICANQKPIINSDCQDIKLAPYNTHYATLDQHINQSKLSVNLINNQWSNPLVFKSPTTSPPTLSISPTSDQSNELKSLNLNDQIYSILEAEEFYPFTIPFNLKGKTKSNPCELPPKYLKSLQTKSSTVQALHKLIQQSTNDQKIRVHILHLIESKFHEWLNESDNIRQINDLINLEIKSQSNSGFTPK